MEERRHDYGEMTKRLSHLESLMAVVQERTEDTKILKKWMVSQIMVVVVAVVAIAVSWGDLHATIESIDVAELETRIDTVLTVIGDHGTELQSVRDEQLRMRESMSTMQKRIFKEIDLRADDRFRRRDFDAIFKPHVEMDQLRWDSIDEKLDTLQADHDFYFRGIKRE